jgi:Spy/CpxP family protein refolding chaperone
VLLGVMLTAAVAAYAADTAQSETGGRHAMGSRLQERLGLTDEQMTAIREIHQRQAEAGKQVWQQVRQARSELRRLALNGADDATLATKATEVKTLLGQLVDLRVSTLRQISPILTPEQREKLATLEYGRHGRSRQKDRS